MTFAKEKLCPKTCAHGSWTPSLVAERLEEAADVLKRLPPIKINGYFSTWPQITSEFCDLVEQKPRLIRPRPTPQAISRMEETLWWTSNLEVVDAKIVLLRARRWRWKEICWKVGFSRNIAHNHWLYALCLIAYRLNGAKNQENLPKNVLVSMVMYQQNNKELSKMH